MGITPDTVERMAHLARLSLSEEDRAVMAEQLERIVAHMGVLTHVEGMEGGGKPVGPEGLREDVPTSSTEREALLGCAPAHDGESYLVPRTVG